MLGKPQDGSLARNSFWGPVCPPQTPTPKDEVMLHIKIHTQKAVRLLQRNPIVPWPFRASLGARTVLFALQSAGRLLGEGSASGDLQLTEGLVLPRDSHCSVPVLS